MTREYDRSRLTPREMEIAKLAASGMINSDIAATLDISPFTVRNVLQRVFRKLHIHERGDLVLFSDYFGAEKKV